MSGIKFVDITENLVTTLEYYLHHENERLAYAAKGKQLLMNRPFESHISTPLNKLVVGSCS